MKDLSLLVDLMNDFYAEAGYCLNRAHATDAFTTFLADERLGYVWIIDFEDQDVGHIVLTLRFAMEYGGIIACLDDLYIEPAWRNRGISTAALAQVREFCEMSDIRALTVEVAPENGPAQTVYRRAGFTEAGDRQLLVLPLAAPSHDVLTSRRACFGSLH